MIERRVKKINKRTHTSKKKKITDEKLLDKVIYNNRLYGRTNEAFLKKVVRSFRSPVNILRSSSLLFHQFLMTKNSYV